MLITTDLHLTDRKRDAYRWWIFDDLRQEADQEGHQVLWILGDLTDRKNNHSAALVNRIIDALWGLGMKVYILKGNHDYDDPECPFFGFLGKDGGPVSFITNPIRVDNLESRKTDRTYSLALPHTRTPEKDWADIDPKGVDNIFCHQTYGGADAGGHTLRAGISSTFWNDKGFNGKVISGDIHVPQKCGDVLYCGSPYHVHFGDRFQPRFLSMKKSKIASHDTHLPRRHIIDLRFIHEGVRDAFDHTKPGDQAKVRIHLPRSEFVDWSEHKATVERIAREKKVALYSVELIAKQPRKRSRFGASGSKPASIHRSNRELLEEYCLARGIEDGFQHVGADLIRRAERR